MILTPQEFAVSAQDALDSLGPIQDSLMDIQDDVPEEFWPGMDAQLDTLWRLQFEIGPRLIQRILDGETEKGAALQRAVEAAAAASADIIRDYRSNYTVSSAVTHFLGDSLETVQKGGAALAKGSFGIGAGLGLGLVVAILLKG